MSPYVTRYRDAHRPEVNAFITVLPLSSVPHDVRLSIRSADKQSDRDSSQGRARDGKQSGCGSNQGRALGDRLSGCGSIPGRATGRDGDDDGDQPS